MSAAWSETADVLMKDSKTIRVVLCEDDPRVRQTLTRAIESQADIDVVAAVGSGEEALDVVYADVDAMVLDVHLPGIDGIEVIRRLREDGHATPIVVLTADDRAAGKINEFDDVTFMSKGTSSALAVLSAIRATTAG